MSDIKAVILAAGKGSRMKSNKPKVLHEIFSKPLLGWVIDAVSDIEPEDPPESIVVIGHGADEVEAYLDKNFPQSKCVLQKEQLGTGHAVSTALPLLADFKGKVIITCGDTPLLSAKSLRAMFDYHNEHKADVTVMSAIFENPFGYGRIIREPDGSAGAIVEQKDTTEEQKTIREINVGVFCLNWPSVKDAFKELKNNNSQGEYYLTDIIAWAKKRGKKTAAYVIDNPDETLGINSRAQLAEAAEIMKNAKLEELMNEGVTIVDPKTTSISPDTIIGADSVVYPNTFINGKNIIGSNCKIGPFSHLRGNVTVGDYSKIGNFVELKNSSIGSHTNVSHLSYVGDAVIGSNVNVGAGTIFANYNSITKEKKQSKLNDGVSIGSNTVIVAPVELGENAFIAAGSVITKNVNADALALTRAAQKELSGWVRSQKENLSRKGENK